MDVRMFSISTANRWLQQILATSWISNVITFKLPLLSTAQIILSRPILYMQISSYQGSWTLGLMLWWPIFVCEGAGLGTAYLPGCMSVLLHTRWWMCAGYSYSMSYSHSGDSSSSGVEQAIIWLPEFFLPFAGALPAGGVLHDPQWSQRSREFL